MYHSNLSGSNASVVKRIVSSWSESEVNWVNQPSVTDTSQVFVPQSTSPTENFIINVTNLVKDAAAIGDSVGFLMKLVDEQYYRALVFASSDNSDSAKWPRLEIEYIPPVIVPSPSIQVSSVPPEIFIPNLFSPNGDGNNDHFLIYGDSIAQISLEIFNRYGEILYRSDDINQIMQYGWDGKFEGKEQPAGTYVWKITGEFTNRLNLSYLGKMTGEVLLIR